MNDFFTLEMLATFAGLVTATGLIVQFTKGIIKKEFDDYVVRIYAFIVALILTAAFAPRGEGMQGVLVTLLNAVLVTLTAMGGYEAINNPTAQ